MAARHLRNTIKVGPFPRFNRHGFLTLQTGPSGEYFVISAPLQEALTMDAKAELREVSIQRFTKHFQEGRDMLERFVQEMEGDQ
jgi:hypothetical protein